MEMLAEFLESFQKLKSTKNMYDKHPFKVRSGIPRWQVL